MARDIRQVLVLLCWGWSVAEGSGDLPGLRPGRPTWQPLLSAGWKEAAAIRFGGNRRKGLYGSLPLLLALVSGLQSRSQENKRESAADVASGRWEAA